MTNHPLRRWRKENDRTAARFGAEIGVTKFAVCDYERCRRFPGPATIAAIERVTGGAVSASDLVAAHQRLPGASPGEDLAPDFPAEPTASGGSAGPDFEQGRAAE